MSKNRFINQSAFINSSLLIYYNYSNRTKVPVTMAVTVNKQNCQNQVTFDHQILLIEIKITFPLHKIFQEKNSFEIENPEPFYKYVSAFSLDEHH